VYLRYRRRWWYPSSTSREKRWLEVEQKDVDQEEKRMNLHQNQPAPS
jgi:hypothetical protein